MKKLLGISIVAVLAVTPLMANATLVNVTVPETITATNDVASTSYVKGAHKELGTAINSLGTTVGDSSTGLVKDVTDLKTTVGNSSSGLVKDVADLKSGNGIAAGSIGLTQLASDVQTSLGKADNAADKDLSNLSNAGAGVITTAVTNNAASGTYSSTGTYGNDTIGKALQGKQNTISDLETIRSGAAAGATALQSNSALNGANLTAGTVAKTALASDVQAALTSAGTALQESSIETGTANGKIKVGTKEVSVYGLGSAAYTASTDYATAAQGALAATALQKADIAEGATNGTIAVDGTDVAVHGLGSAAYANTTDFDSAGAASGAEAAAKAYADAKLVTVHTTWGTDSATAPANVIVNPAQ